MTTNAEVVAAIINGELDDDLDRIREAVRSRQNEVRDRQARINALTLKPGTRVKLKDLSPKYLNGLEGEIVADTARRSGRGKQRLVVKLDHPAGRYGSTVRPPASCVEPV